MTHQATVIPNVGIIFEQAVSSRTLPITPRAVAVSLEWERDVTASVYPEFFNWYADGLRFWNELHKESDR